MLESSKNYDLSLYKAPVFSGFSERIFPGDSNISIAKYAKALPNLLNGNT
jgi:hypothetical protein